MPKVGIVISNYNGWQDTLVCLDSLQKQTYKDFEIILLDDASPNDSVAQLQDKLLANTVFLPQEQNLGFAAVNNVGMRRALADGCDYVLLLNNDTTVAPDMLETLLRETPAGAVSCPKMLFMDPPDEIWFAGGTLDPATGKVKHLGGHAKDGPAFAQKQQVSFITFCCVLLPRAVIEQVGYLDETLFMYCEDVDYCIRLGQAGVLLWFLPALMAMLAAKHALSRQGKRILMVDDVYGGGGTTKALNELARQAEAIVAAHAVVGVEDGVALPEGLTYLFALPVLD